jgi:hypothetical protein
MQPSIGISRGSSQGKKSSMFVEATYDDYWASGKEKKPNNQQ